jgi:hypothetical protein
MPQTVNRSWTVTLRTAAKVLERGAVAFGVAAVISGVVRFVPRKRTPTQRGGWAEVTEAELQ